MFPEQNPNMEFLAAKLQLQTLDLNYKWSLVTINFITLIIIIMWVT